MRINPALWSSWTDDEGREHFKYTMRVIGGRQDAPLHSLGTVNASFVRFKDAVQYGLKWNVATLYNLMVNTWSEGSLQGQWNNCIGYIRDRFKEIDPYRLDICGIAVVDFQNGQRRLGEMMGKGRVTIEVAYCKGPPSGYIVLEATDALLPLPMYRLATGPLAA